ncbi:SDR family NAD(P)-dependent oxidoreductase [Streptosporangium saharense]|uniref:SDR family NAD(P)-dependent oxidoreductase n=1 Tax=Streptosporangium saharense TaxID=1706840 RepID=UPI0034141C48
MTAPRRVCVTGAASGIGHAAADAFLANGHHVALVDRDENALTEAVERLTAEHGPGRALPYVVDIAVAGQVAVLFARLADTGGLDTLILAAGVTSDGFVSDMSEHDWSYILGVNLTGAFLCLKGAAPLLRRSSRGSVVAVGSVSAHVVGAGGGCAAYEASKAGLVQLVRAFAVENAPYGVRANVVSPGRTATRLGENTRRLAETVYTSADGPRRERHPFGAPLRFEGRPEEIAGAIHFLAGDDARFVTGTELLVDGGYTAI